MSPYAEELAYARLEAIRQLVTAMRATDDPGETRRCALAIFSAPDPCDLDDEIELEDEEEADDADHTEDDSDEDEDSEEDEEDDDSETAEGTSNSPHAGSVSTSDIAHPTSDIPPDTIAKATALLENGALNLLVAPS